MSHSARNAEFRVGAILNRQEGNCMRRTDPLGSISPGGPEFLEYVQSSCLDVSMTASADDSITSKPTLQCWW